MELTIKTKAFDQVLLLLTEASTVTFVASEFEAQVAVTNEAFTYLFRPEAKIVSSGSCTISGADLLSVLQANKFRKKLRLIFNSDKQTLTINSKSWLFKLLAV